MAGMSKNKRFSTLTLAVNVVTVDIKSKHCRMYRLALYLTSFLRPKLLYGVSLILNA